MEAEADPGYSLIHLPTEVVMYIFSFLPTRTLGVLSTVCKEFKRIARDDALVIRFLINSFLLTILKWKVLYRVQWGQPRFPPVDSDSKQPWKHLYWQQDVFTKR